MVFFVSIVQFHCLFRLQCLSPLSVLLPLSILFCLHCQFPLHVPAPMSVSFVLLLQVNFLCPLSFFLLHCPVPLSVSNACYMFNVHLQCPSSLSSLFPLYNLFLCHHCQSYVLYFTLLPCQSLYSSRASVTLLSKLSPLVYNTRTTDKAKSRQTNDEINNFANSKFDSP